MDSSHKTLSVFVFEQKLYSCILTSLTLELKMDLNIVIILGRDLILRGGGLKFKFVYFLSNSCMLKCLNLCNTGAKHE